MSAPTAPTPARRRGTRDVAFIAVLCGLLAMLCIHIAVGLTHGFARASGGPLVALLAAPGLALGWGGVALLIMVVPHVLLTWRQGDPTGDGRGRLLAVLGAAVVALGVGGLAGLTTQPAAVGGGVVAGGVAALLRESVGTGLASALLGLITVPGMLLGLAPLVLAGGVARVAARAADTGVKPWYPQRRVGADGDEAPPDFGGATDVGPIRFRDEPAAAPSAPRSTISLSPPALTGAAARKAKPIPGVRYADDPLPELGAPASTTVEEPGGAEARLAAGVRFAAPPPPPVASPPPPTEAAPLADVTDVPPLALTPVAAPLADVGTPTPRESDARPSVAPAPRAPVEEPVREAVVLAERVPPTASDLVAEAAAAVAAESGTGAAYRRKLDGTGLLGGPSTGRPPPTPRLAMPTAVRAPTRLKPLRPTRPKDTAEAIRGLFSSLPFEELSPVQPEIDPPEPPPPLDVPGQGTLFDEVGRPVAPPPLSAPVGAEATTAKARPARAAKAARDPLFAASVEAALERGSASVVSLKRRLGVGYARAASLMEALADAGVVGEMTASGSRPTLLSATEWARRQRAG